MTNFGIPNADGKTASSSNQESISKAIEVESGKQAWRATKRQLIETFSHEHAGGKLLRNLTSKLAAHGVALSPIPQEQVFEILQQQERLDPFTRLVATFLQHFKGSRLSLSEIARRAANHRHPARAAAFLAVFGPI